MHMHQQSDTFESVSSVRRPIQCEGIARGPERMAEIAAGGAVNPQFWGALASLAIPAISGIIKNL
jgi:hypothetical protein